MILHKFFKQKSKDSKHPLAIDAILEAIDKGILICDKSERVTLVNRNASKLLRFSKDYLIGKNFVGLNLLQDKAGNTISAENSPVRIAIQSSKEVSIATYYCIREDQTRFPTSFTAAPIIVENEIIGAVIVFDDETKEKDLNEEKIEFVELASHQMRSPVTAVKWYAELLMTSDLSSLDTIQKKSVNEIYKASRKMVELANSLLIISQLELGTFIKTPEKISIIKIANDVLQSLHEQIVAKKIEVRLHFDETLPTIYEDPKVITTTFYNVLANAVFYTQDKGIISISVQKSPQDQNTIVIMINDTGYGIAKNEQSKIFTKLFRAENESNKVFGKAGLGLYIVKLLINNIGGKIWFTSEEGKGTSFYVSFPVQYKE